MVGGCQYPILVKNAYQIANRNADILYILLIYQSRNLKQFLPKRKVAVISI
jgi:hypothetical protein